MREEKRELRVAMRELRAGLEPEARAAAHAALAAALSRLLARHSAVAVYAARPDEADPITFARAFLARGGRVSYPRVTGASLSWHVVPAQTDPLDPLDWLVPGFRGILEPPAGAPAHAREQLSAIVVPGLAFAPDGVRLGQGAGYYDHALAGYAGLKVGLAYRGQCVPVIACEPHDVRMDLIVSA